MKHNSSAPFPLACHLHPRCVHLYLLREYRISIVVFRGNFQNAVMVPNTTTRVMFVLWIVIILVWSGLLIQSDPDKLPESRRKKQLPAGAQ